MPIYIDESGDTGHAKDSSPFFRLAAVRLPSLREAEALRDEIRGVRKEFQIGVGYEFKFNKTHTRPAIRRAFLEAVCPREFRFAACAIDKMSLDWRLAGSEELHWASATVLAAAMRPILQEAETPGKPLGEPIFVDDNGDRKFLKAVADAFRGLKSQLHPEFAMVRNPKFRGSHPDEIMQLVDMLCGAAGAHLDGDSTWFEIVKTNCIDIVCLP